MNEGDLEDLMGFYQRGRNKGDFEGGITTAVQAIISSPEFVFSFRTDACGEKLPGERFGTRLPALLFSWSTAPDDQLISLASAGQTK